MRSPSVAALLAVVAAAAAGASPASAALKLRLATPSASVTVPPTTSVGNVFDDAQRFSTQCRGSESALAPGIVDAPRHIVGQSFGPSAVSGFATGTAGRARLRLQLLCASGANITHKRVEGRTRSAGTTLTTTATARCGASRYAIGAPLSQEFAPGFGRFASRPASASTWQVTVEGVPADFPLTTTPPAYADVACVPKSALKSVKTIDDSTEALATATSAQLKLSCTGGRRAVGWGVDLRPFTRSGSGWQLPMVRRAALAGTSVQFTFELPPGARPGAENGLSPAEVAQTAYVVCGKPA